MSCTNVLNVQDMELWYCENLRMSGCPNVKQFENGGMPYSKNLRISSYAIVKNVNNVGSCTILKTWECKNVQMLKLQMLRCYISRTQDVQMFKKSNVEVRHSKNVRMSSAKYRLATSYLLRL